MSSKNRIITIIGKSGSGKSEIASRLEKIFNYNRPKNITTRPRRPGEEEISDYIHTDHEGFFQELKNNNLVEYTYFGGNFYGIQRTQGNNIIIAEPIGAFQIKKYCYENDIENIMIKIECEETERLRRIGEDEKRKSRVEGFFDIFDSSYDYKVDNTGDLELSIKAIEETIENHKG